MSGIDLSKANLVVLQEDPYERGTFVMQYNGSLDQVFNYGTEHRPRIIIPDKKAPLSLYMAVLAEGVEFDKGEIVREKDLAEIRPSVRLIQLDGILKSVERERLNLAFANSSASTPSAAQTQSRQ